ncbi:MAG: radical SAM protein [Promethearchaeota archaeon]
MWKALRPDAARSLGDPMVRERFPSYVGILEGRFRARYLVAKELELERPSLDDQASLEDAWRIHDAAAEEFRNFLADERKGEQLPKETVPAYSFLDLKADLASKLVENCCLCERRCGAKRKRGKTGICGLDATALVSSAFLHVGEEAPLVPSGTIFFTGCTFSCVFCQNFDISQEWRRSPQGRPVDGEALAKIATRLADSGARNVNYVGGDPTSHAHVVLDSLRHQDRNVTQLWNSNLYASSELMALLLDVVDFWLPDFKYGNDDCARKYSKVDNYWEVVTRNHALAHDVGSGEVIVRHLVMPGHVECCTKPVLNWLADHAPNVVVNVMGQYRPEYKARRFPEINRRPTREEMNEARAHASELGLVWRLVA